MTDPIREFDPSRLPPAPPEQTATPRDGVRRQRKRERAWQAIRERNSERKRETVRTAGELVNLWRREVLFGRERATDGRPKGLARPLRKEGETIGAQARRFLEETEGFVLVERELRAAHGLEAHGAETGVAMWITWEPWPRQDRPETVTIAVFMARLEARLPYEFLAPWEGLCEAELDELKAAEQANAKADEEEDAEVDAVTDPQGRLLPGLRREP